MGRAAAGQLLEEIGIVSPQGILKGSEGEPIWPEGCVGSISHSAGIAIAAAARTENFSGIGVDLELWNPSRDYKFLSKALNPDEQEWVGCDHKKGLQIFSAKEALYKLIFSGFGLKPTFGSVSFMTELDGKLTAQWNVLGKTEEELQKLLPSPSCQSYVCKDSSDKDYLVNVCWLDANLET
jgi:4'-phosphopantetheinyl transferase EntD